MAYPHSFTKPSLLLHGAKGAPLVRLAIVTESCPNVVSDVLATLARHAVIPWGIHFRRTSQGLSLVVEVENYPGVGKLASRIEVLTMVREVCVLEGLTEIALDHG